VVGPSCGRECTTYLIRLLQIDDILGFVEGSVAAEGVAEDGLVPVDVHGDGVDSPFDEGGIIGVDADINGSV
jgi:hypothetical protein